MANVYSRAQAQTPDPINMYAADVPLGHRLRLRQFLANLQAAQSGSWPRIQMGCKGAAKYLKVKQRRARKGDMRREAAERRGERGEALYKLRLLLEFIELAAKQDDFA